MDPSAHRDRAAPYCGGRGKRPDLARNAAEQALARAGMTGADIDLIIIATSTPDDTFPSTATKVQHQIDAHNAIAFDMQAVCAGFVYALDVADAMLSGAGEPCACHWG